MISRLRLHPTILLMASAHLMVDGYGNIYAPMLPLLIPRLGLSLAAAGTLTMLFQLAASVAQGGVGDLADRWTPRTFDTIAPGPPASPPPAAALARRLGGERRGYAMSVYITGGTLGFALGPLCFAPFAQ